MPIFFTYSIGLCLINKLFPNISFFTSVLFKPSLFKLLKILNNIYTNFKFLIFFFLIILYYSESLGRILR